MELLSLIVGLVGVVFLVLQASSCLFQSDRPLSIGFVNIMLAALVVFAVFSLYSGSMVIAPEFGVILLQGTWTIRLFRLALVLSAIVPGLVWHEIRNPSKWNSRVWVLFLPGAALGVCAAFHVHLINPLDADALHVYAYDVWFPPLMLWLATCFSVVTMAIVALDRKLAYVSFIAAVFTPLAAFALQFVDLPDPYSQPVWTFVERASFCVAVLIVVYLATEELAWKWRGPSLAVAAAVGILFGFLNLSKELRAGIGIVPLAFWLFAWFTMVFTAPPEEAPDREPDKTQLQAAVTAASRPFSMKRIRGTLVALSLPLFFACLVDFFSVSWAYRWFDVGALLFLWLFFAERLARGALTWLPKLIEGGVLKFRPLRAVAEWVGKGAGAVWRGIVSIGSFFWTGNKWTVTAKLLLLPIGYLALLAIGNELVNYRKIVIREFSCTGCTKENGAEGFASALVNELGQLRGDLLSDVIIAQRSTGKDQKSIQMLSAGSDSSTMESVAAKSDDLQVSGLKIPMKVFVEPVQQFVRSLLGIRTIEGTIRIYDHKRFVVFANSSAGDSWRVWATTEKTDSPSDVKSSETPGSPDGAKAENATPPEKSESAGEGKKLEPGEKGKSPDKRETASTPSNQSTGQCSTEAPSEPVMALVKDLAFEIAKSDPSFKTVGFTSDLQALDYFRKGLRHWRRFESSSAETRELRIATACFQKAVERDRTFAPAQYRLGLAMQRLLQADAAIAAFKGTVEANPQFFSGKVLQAATLYSYSNYKSPVTPVMISRLGTPGDRKAEAFQIWTELLQLPHGSLSVSEQRSTYLGICQYELYEVPPASDFTSLQLKTKNYLPYFYCSRVSQLMRDSPSPLVNDAQERTLEGNALFFLGLIMELQDRSDHEYDRSNSKLQWTCNAEWIKTEELEPPLGLQPAKDAKFYVLGSRYSGAAAKYYQKSLQLIPGDPNVLCSLASAKFYLDPNDTRLMTEISSKAEVRANLGATYENKARDNQYNNSHSPAGEADPKKLDLISYYYRSAMDEYERAILLDPTYLEALNGYAYAFWEWRLAFLERNVPHDADERNAAKAEKYCRSEVRIARDLRRNDWLNVADDTLAEVLMAEGRFSEAVHQVDQALNQLNEHMQSGTNEIHWDAAQANLCAAAFETDASVRQKEYAEASQQIQIIKTTEDGAEAQQFTAYPEVLDPYRRRLVCAMPPEKVTLAAEKYHLRQSNPIAGPCGWFGVTGEVHGQTTEEVLQLHVWGGGVNETVDLIPPAPASVVLSISSGQTPSNSRSYYFARVESGDVPLSRTVTFNAAQNAAVSSCAKNGVNLVFDRIPSRPQPTKRTTQVAQEK